MARTHGMKHSAEYVVWNNMMARCGNPKNKGYRYYGGRGITVDDALKTFTGFFKVVGPRPAGTSLDRIDNDLGYIPGNLRWATKAQQMSNRSDNRKVTYGDDTLTITEWAQRLGIKPQTLWYRIAVKKWPAEKALTVPVMTSSEAGKHGSDARWKGEVEYSGFRS